MTSKERIELHDTGLTILRPQWNHRKNMWRVVVFTGKGWTWFDTQHYKSKEEANAYIINYCQTHKNYKNDD
jgi:hypothetical protein